MISMVRVRQRGDMILAWISFGLAVVGGALAASTGVGEFVHTVLHGLPWHWLPGVGLAAAFVTIAIDLFRDGDPNQAAVAAAILLPSVAAATGGSLGRWVIHSSAALAHWTLPHMQAWVGTSSSVGLALGAIAIASVVSSRVVKRSRGGSRPRTTVSVG